MIDTKADLRRLVEGLYQATAKGHVSWRYDASSDLCETQVGDGYIQIVREADEDGDYYSYIKVLNSEKQVIDNIYGGSLGFHKPVNTEHKDYWALMSDLRESAERQALGADKVISSILTELGATELNVDDVPF